MAEENKKVEKKTEDSKEEIDPTTALIDKANSAAKRLESANEQTKALLDRQEQLAARSALGGVSEAGEVKKEVEISPQEYAQKVLRGELNEKQEEKRV